MTADPREPSDLDLARRLRALRVDPPDGGFSAGLHLRLAGAEVPAPEGLAARLWRGLRRPVVLGSAAGALAAALVLVLAGLPGGREAEPAVALPASQVALVRLRLSADVAVSAADIRVTLPEGLSFWSEGAALPQRHLEWTQALLAGDNEIPVAVKGVRPGRYRMAVAAQLNGGRIEHEVVLEVTPG